MSYNEEIRHQISSANSTTAELGAAATWLGSWEDVTDYATVAVAIDGDIPTDGTLWIQASQDGGTNSVEVPFTVADTTFALPRIWNVAESHIRIKYVNGTTSQVGNGFRLQTKYSNGQELGLLATMGDVPTNDTTGQTVKAITAGAQPDGTYKNNPYDGIAFTTSANLGAAGNYTSSWISTDGFNSIELFVHADEVSASQGLVVEFTDNLDTPSVQESITYTYTQADVDRGYLDIFLPPKLEGYRVSYTNGSTVQASFLLQCDLKVNGDNQRYNSGGALIIGDFKTEIALGHVPNHSADAKFGYVSVLDAADPESTVWSAANDDAVNQLAKKTFPTATGTLHMASANAGDTATITIVYSDASNNLQEVSAPLTGQTPVSLGVTAFDANIAYISGSDETLAGDVYISLNSSYTSGVPTTLTDTIAHITAAAGRTQQATYRVPANSRLAMTNIYASISRASGTVGSAQVNLRHKPNGGSWTTLRPYPITTAQLIDTKESLIFEAGDLIEFVIDDVSDTDTTCVVIFEHETVTE